MTKLILLLPVLILAAGFFFVYYRRLGFVTGYAAKNICSAVFLAGRDQRSVETGENGTNLMKYARSSVDKAAGSVTSTVFGLKPRTAVYRDGVGCVLLPEGGGGPGAAAYKPVRSIAVSSAPYPCGSGTAEQAPLPGIDTAALSRAVANAFDSPGQKLKKTAAVIVVHNDRIIAEQYAPGFGRTTRLAGWSMTKSLTSAIVGVLVKKGKLDTARKNLFPEWTDGRSEITLAQLLNMNSGLEWTEDYSNSSGVLKMLYEAADMGAVQRGKPLTAAPGGRWRYSSGVTNLLALFLRGQFPTQQAYLDFWYAGLVDQLGMSSMVLETDLAGNYVGSSYAWATARDWAKFGLLYLHRGSWNGRQVLTPAWVDFTAAPAAGSNGAYGAHFWLNAGGKFPAAPEDMFYCAGHYGQYIFILPSQNTVIARFGLGGKAVFDANLFLKEVLSAIPG